MVSHKSDIPPDEKPQEQPASAADDPRPVIGITMGDPAGIGAEVVIKALADPVIRKLARFEIYGMNELLSYAADLAEIDPFWWRVQHESNRATGDMYHNVMVRDYDEISFLGQSIHRPTKQGGSGFTALSG